MKLLIALAVTFALSAAAAGAAPLAWVPSASPAYAQCMAHGDAAQGQTKAMEDCGDAEIARQQHTLADAYTALLARTSAPRVPQLRAAQRAWLANRESTCRAAIVKDDGGTIAGIDYQGCIIARTALRIRQLQHT